MSGLAERRRSPAGRALEIAARTAHLSAMAVLAGGAWFAAPADALGPWIGVTAVTGAALLAAEVSHSRHWAYQGRGLLALAHLALAGLAVHLPLVEGRRAAMAAALVVGGVGSHLPGAIRKWSIRHGRVME